MTIAYAHNIVLDLWLRLGLIGLVLFVVAFAASLIDGIKVWRRHTDPKTAALALALVAVLCGLIATAFLEPFLDEYRLATLFGVSLGMLRGTVTSMIGRLPVWHSEEIGPPCRNGSGLVNLTIGVHSMAPAGGTELNVFQVSRGLAQRGHVIDLISPRDGSLADGYRTFCRSVTRPPVFDFARSTAARDLVRMTPAVRYRGPEEGRRHLPEPFRRDRVGGGGGPALRVAGRVPPPRDPPCPTWFVSQQAREALHRRLRLSPEPMGGGRTQSRADRRRAQRCVG